MPSEQEFTPPPESQQKKPESSQAGAEGVDSADQRSGEKSLAKFEIKDLDFFIMEENGQCQFSEVKDYLHKTLNQLAVWVRDFDRNTPRAEIDEALAVISSLEQLLNSVQIYAFQENAEVLFGIDFAKPKFYQAALDAQRREIAQISNEQASVLLTQAEHIEEEDQQAQAEQSSGGQPPPPPPELQNSELLPDEKRSKLEELYKEFYGNLKSSNTEVQIDLRNQILDMAEGLGERRRWELAIKIYDGMMAAANLPGNKEFDIHLGFNDEFAAWDAIAIKAKLEHMRELMSLDPQISKILEVIGTIFDNGGNYYQAVVSYLQDRGLQPSEAFEKDGEDMCGWSYREGGQPRAGDRANGALLLQDLLKEIFPNTRDSSVTMATDIAICTGARSKAFIKSCYGYSTSPKAYYGGKGLAKIVAPAAYSMYYIRKVPWVPIGMRDIMLYYDFEFPENIADKVERDGIVMRFNDNVRVWKSFKEKIESLLTNVSFKKYQKKIDFSRWDEGVQILPAPWDLLWTKDSGAMNLDLDEYSSSIKKFEELFELISHIADKPMPKNRGEDSLASRLKLITDADSPIKGAYESLRSTEYLPRYADLLKFLHFVALKKLFDLYFQAEVGGPFKSLGSIRKSFVRIVNSSGLVKGNVPKEVREFVKQEFAAVNRTTKQYFSPEPVATKRFEALMTRAFDPEKVDDLRQLLSKEVDEEAKND